MNNLDPRATSKNNFWTTKEKITNNLVNLNPTTSIILEKGMATHSSILAWRIPWTGGLVRLQSVESQRVKYNWVTEKISIITKIIKTFQLKNTYSLLAQLIKDPLQRRRPWLDSWVQKIHWRRDRLPTPLSLGFPCGPDGKESTCNAGDLGSIPGWERPPGVEKGYHSNILA